MHECAKGMGCNMSSYRDIMVNSCEALAAWISCLPVKILAPSRMSLIGSGSLNMTISLD